MSNWDAVWYLGPRAHEPGFARDHHELLALMAPRSFLLLAGGSADGPESGAYIAAAQPVWRLLGAPEKLVGLLHGSGTRLPAECARRCRGFSRIGATVARTCMHLASKHCFDFILEIKIVISIVACAGVTFPTPTSEVLHESTMVLCLPAAPRVRGG
jgi:hypothetical protein